MRYCNKCVYPENARPGVVFDNEGVCSGCRLIESRKHIKWVDRENLLVDLLNEYKKKQRKKNNNYDCIIPVSGGKDSTFQTWLIKKKYNLNPLLVTYNHTFNTPLGLRNLSNLVEKLDCHLLRFTSSPKSAIKIAKYMLKKVGDVTWHYHAGIMTFPIQVSIAYDIPLIIWGEEGFSELLGMHNQDDFVEFTKKKRQEHSMRGFEPEDLLQEGDCPLTPYDLSPFFYPKDELIKKVGTRGIYLSNFISWNAKKQTEFIIKKLGFETSQGRERTFNLYDKLDDIHANGLHDYLKYLKFGYGRCTDDVATEIRHGRLTRNEGIELVKKYDHVKPSDMKIFLKESKMTEKQFFKYVDKHRDPSIWEKKKGKWVAKDSVANHKKESGKKNSRNSKQKLFLKTKEKKSLHSQPNNNQTKYVIL
jgi:N-acetyl sugar amidotransferase